MGSWFPNHWLNPCSLQWKHRVLTSGPPEKSLWAILRWIKSKEHCRDYNLPLTSHSLSHSVLKYEPLSLPPFLSSFFLPSSSTFVVLDFKYDFHSLLENWGNKENIKKNPKLSVISPPRDKDFHIYASILFVFKSIYFNICIIQYRQWSFLFSSPCRLLSVFTTSQSSKEEQGEIRKHSSGISAKK